MQLQGIIHIFIHMRRLWYLITGVATLIAALLDAQTVFGP